MELFNRKEELLKEIERLEKVGDMPKVLELAKEVLELQKIIAADPDLHRMSVRNYWQGIVKEEEDLELAISYARRVFKATGDYEYSIQDTAMEFGIRPDVIQMELTYNQKFKYGKE